jgi:hypothetical protein
MPLNRYHINELVDIAALRAILLGSSVYLTVFLEQIFHSLFHFEGNVLSGCLGPPSFLKVIIGRHCLWIVKLEGVEVHMVWVVGTTACRKQEVPIEVQIRFEREAELEGLRKDIVEIDCDKG